jgi:DNA polymerase I-like protein with 3'-5' exonuclease and polymerase domains
MFFDTYRGMALWQRETAQTSERTQRAITPGGRVRDFSIEGRGYRYTEALNTPIQGGAAEVLLAALARLEDALAGLDAGWSTWSMTSWCSRWPRKTQRPLRRL